MDDDVGELVFRAHPAKSPGKLIQVISRIPLRSEQELAAVWDDVWHPVAVIFKHKVKTEAPMNFVNECTLSTEIC